MLQQWCCRVLFEVRHFGNRLVHIMPSNDTLQYFCMYPSFVTAVHDYYTLNSSLSNRDPLLLKKDFGATEKSHWLANMNLKSSYNSLCFNLMLLIVEGGEIQSDWPQTSLKSTTTGPQREA